ncbi:MAG TPA: tetratricopeptide repeat protein [Candidatus Polarisedimenticolia bacterium]
MSFRTVRLLSLFLLGAVALSSAAGCTNIQVRRAMNKGVNAFKSKEFEQALGHFKQAAAIDSSYAEAYLDMGLTYMEMYEPGSEHPKDKEYADGAIQAFKKNIELEPDNEKVKEYLVNVCKLANRVPEAIDFFMADYNRNPNDVNLVRKMANLYSMAGMTDKMIEWYEKAQELDPGNPESHYSVGVSCWARSYNSPYMPYEERMAMLDKGQAALEKALGLRKEYFEALSYLSLLYRQKAQYDISPAQAVTWRQKADELLAKAMELRNRQLKAQADSAAAAGGGSPSTPAPQPAGPGGQ